MFDAILKSQKILYYSCQLHFTFLSYCKFLIYWVGVNKKNYSVTFHRNGQTPKEYEKCRAKFGDFYPYMYTCTLGPN